MTIRTRLVPLLLTLCVSAGTAGDKSLYWKRLDVQATLDADGRLHVRELHGMVFTGDWNGGERRFRQDLGQHLLIERISRIDPSGALHDLIRGDLSRVDHFNWADSNTLRWRSRLPTDPPFDETEIDYVLEYTMSNILIPEGEAYLLDHDFAFPGRTGRIDKYRLELRLDPAWDPERSFKQNVETGPLSPGERCVVRVPLKYGPGGRPAGVTFGAGAAVRYPLAALVTVSVLFISVSFLRHEKSLGKFAPLVPSSAINESWLNENVFRFAPEVAGAAWDEVVGAPEVGAVLARMVCEKKLRSQVDRRPGVFKENILRLELLVDRKELTGYEADLVNALFFSGDSTDTESIKEHYKVSGFDPAGKIRKPLDAAVNALASQSGKPPKPSRLPSLLLVVLAFSLLTAASVLRTEELLISLVALGLGALFYTAALVLALVWRKRIVGLIPASLGLVLPLLVLTVATTVIILEGRFRASAWLLTGFAALCLAAIHSVFNTAKAREGAEKTALRKKLASAREYFREQLWLPKPNLKDAWYPYLIAFGLGKHVDHWFKAYGGDISPSRLESSSAGSSGSTSPAATGWTGGGGSFGGAGASASWAAAAGVLASGIASPSSSSGGGGGGSSSGGGGGGGW